MPNTWNTNYDAYSTGKPAGPKYNTTAGTNANEQVLGLYQRNFGRSASLPEIDGWVNFAGNGTRQHSLTPEQLYRVQAEFEKAPEYQSYTGYRPNVAIGSFIPGVTLGTTLDNDAALRLLMESPAPAAPQPQYPRVPTSAYGEPLDNTTQGTGALANRGRIEDETMTAGTQNQFRDTLVNILNQGVPSVGDPTIAPQISAFREAQNRATARQVNANAEAFGTQGLEASGARLGADNAAIAQQGLNEGTFNSTLLSRELEQRRAQIMQALQLVGGQLDSDSERRLRAHLAEIDAALRTRQTNVQQKLGQGDLDTRRFLGVGNLNLGLIQSLLQDRQFGDSLGFNMASLEAQLNNQATRALLGI